MITLAWILVGITVLFFTVLAVKKWLPDICAICTAIGISWVILLVLWWRGLFADTLIIGILMGESIVGLYYLLRSHLVEHLHLFSLPFILTLTLATYGVLARTFPVDALLVVSIVWVVFGAIFIARRSPVIIKVFKALIACCKNW